MAHLRRSLAGPREGPGMTLGIGVRSRGAVAWTVLVVGLGLALSAGHAQAPDRHPLIRAVGAVGMTVGDMERSVAFYAGVLGFEKVTDVEVWGEDYERLHGVFGLRMRVVRMRLGDEAIELTEYL